MRNDEREPALTQPPDVRLDAARAQPATTAVPVRVEQDRTAVGILDRFVHGDDPDQAHRLDVLVREVLADEAGDLGVGLRQLALVGLGTNLFRDPIVVLEEHALEDGDLGGDTGGRLEIRRAKRAFGAGAQTEALALEPLDPLETSCAVGSDAEVDDAVLFTPTRFRKTRCHRSVLECLKNVGKLSGVTSSIKNELVDRSLKTPQPRQLRRPIRVIAHDISFRDKSRY